MRTREWLLWLFLGTFVLVGLLACRTEDATPEPTLPHSMKGYELYSWQADGSWSFALLAGTNRIKTYQEVTEAPERAKGTEALLEQLGRLPQGEQVFWLIGRVPGMSPPPPDILEEASDLCRRRGVHLEIVQPR